jgi:hypothetical protein
MKISRYLLGLMLPLLCCTHVDGQLTYARSLGLPGGETYLAPHPMTGGSLLLGNGYPHGSLSATRLDAQGQTVNAYQLDGQNAFGIFDVELLADSSYIACGMESSGQLGTWTFIISLDSGGVPQRIARADPAEQYVWADVQALPEAGFVLIGYALETPHRIRKCGAVTRFDSNMDTMWTREISFAGHQTRLWSGTLLPGGDLALYGAATDTMTFVNKPFLCRMSKAGDLRWIRAFSAQTGHTYFGEKVVRDGAGRLYLSGIDFDNQSFEAHPALFAFDAEGNLLWARDVHKVDYAAVLAECLLQGGDVAIGGIAGDSLGNRHGFVASFSSSGNLQWVRVFGLGTQLTWSDILALPGGGLQLTGNSSNMVQVHQTDAQGEIAGSCNSVAMPTQSMSLTPVTHSLTPILQRGVQQTFVPAASSPMFLTNTVDCLTLDHAPARAPLRATLAPQPMRTSAQLLLPAASMKPHAQLLLHDRSGRAVHPSATRLPDGWEILRGGLPAGIYAYQVLQGGQRIASGKLWIAD